jgi:glycosyltransferase involved in cell wall biosynthesis
MVCRLADAVIAVSDRDKEAIQAVAPDVRIHVVPNGVDNAFFSRFIPHESYVTARHVITHMSSLAFAGTMDYRPNVDAMLWFYHEILPLIKKDCFNVHLYIVGRSPVKEIMRLAIDPAITVTGYVNDIRPYIAHSRVFVVPIRMGSGTKLKVLQAMAMGVPVVSTSLGAEGIKVTDGENILIADTPAEFAQKVLLLLQDERQRQIISRNARQLVEEYYDWSVVVPRLHAVYEDLPTRPRR